MGRILAGAFAFLALGIAAQAAQDDGFLLLRLNDQSVKWGSPAFGLGATVSYAVIDGQTRAGGVRNCRKIEGVRGLLKHSRLSRSIFDGELRAALSMWEHAADVHFVPARNARSADVLIAAQAEPEGWAYADVTAATRSDATATAITKGIVCLNPQLTWTSHPVRQSAKAPARKSFWLRYVLAHEIGHVLGLDHPDSKSELMSFKYNAKMRGLQGGDIAGIVAIYGPAAPKTAVAFAKAATAR